MFVKVTLRDAKEDVDKVCIEVQNTSDNAGGKRTRGFSLEHKTFSALNYAQDFGTTVKESLKELGIRSGLHSQKVELSLVKYFRAFISSVNCLSHRCKQ